MDNSPSPLWAEFVFLPFPPTSFDWSPHLPLFSKASLWWSSLIEGKMSDFIDCDLCVREWNVQMVFRGWVALDMWGQKMRMSIWTRQQNINRMFNGTMFTYFQYRDTINSNSLFHALFCKLSNRSIDDQTSDQPFSA